MKLLEMEAGREMDALVAEKVMGWTVKKEGYSTWVVITDTYWTRPLVGGEGGSWGNWTPSTDIAAALPVLEKWTDAEIEKAGGNYRVTLIGAPIVTADAKTLPLAICRAALKAAEAKDNL